MGVIRVARHAVSLSLASQASRGSSEKQQAPCSLARYQFMMLSYIRVLYAHFIKEIETVGNGKPRRETHKSKIKLMRLLRVSLFCCNLTRRWSNPYYDIIIYYVPGFDMLETRVKPAQTNVPKTIYINTGNNQACQKTAYKIIYLYIYMPDNGKKVETSCRGGRS